MNRQWLEKKRDELVTDILRNFCLIHQTLEQEFSIYQQSGEIRFKVLDELLGQEMAQGRLWLLKDTAHLLFHKHPDTPLVGTLLDWAIAYIFHECMKLKEDAYQLQTYIPWFQLVQTDPRFGSREQDLGSNLFHLASQTKESISREVHRIGFLLSESQDILIQYLSRHNENRILARFMFEHEDRIEAVFKERHQQLLTSIYGSAPERQFLLAARALKEGGWRPKAEEALGRAAQLNPDHPEIASLQEDIAQLEDLAD